MISLLGKTLSVLPYLGKRVSETKFRVYGIMGLKPFDTDENSDYEENYFLEEKRREALTNDLILVEIFKNLDLRDLVSSRLVNKQWNFNSSSVIIQKDLCKLTLKINSNHGVQESKLAGLLNCLEHCNMFLWTSIDVCLTAGNNIQDIHYHLILHRLHISTRAKEAFLKTKSPGHYFVEFLRLFGHNVRHASITVIRYHNDKKIFHMILGLLPWLQSLKVNEVELPLLQSSGLLSPTPILNTLVERPFPLQLLSLQNLDFCVYNFFGVPYPRLLEAILEASPNLCGIYNFQLEMFGCVERAGKIQLVKGCNIDYSHFENDDCDPQAIKNLQIFSRASSNVQLEIFVLGKVNVDIEIDSEAAECFSRILQSSHKTLKKLRIPAFKFIQNIVLPPVFPELVHLCVDVRSSSNGTDDFSIIFPLEYMSNSRFPFPKVAHFTLRTSIPFNPKNIDEHDPTLKAITNLLSGFKSLTNFEQLC